LPHPRYAAAWKFNLPSIAPKKTIPKEVFHSEERKKNPERNALTFKVILSKK